MMSQIGSDDNPIVFRQTIVSTDSRFRKNFDKQKYDFNYDRIFNKGSKDKKAIREYNSELEACRAKSKTFSMDQE
tara:strand:- start:1040 stop:1264 length:225 start_codon:yes stop_codon:yes gene_type:complete